MHDLYAYSLKVLVTSASISRYCFWFQQCLKRQITTFADIIEYSLSKSLSERRFQVAKPFFVKFIHYFNQYYRNYPSIYLRITTFSAQELLSVLFCFFLLIRSIFITLKFRYYLCFYKFFWIFKKRLLLIYFTLVILHSSFTELVVCVKLDATAHLKYYYYYWKRLL